MKSERAGTEVFLIVLVGLVVLSLLQGYWRIMVLHDFTIFTSEEEGGAYVAIPESLPF